MAPDVSSVSPLQQLTNRLFNALGGPRHDCVDWKTLHDGLVRAYELGKLAALAAPVVPSPPPAVHHLCGPTVIGVTGPPHASWCYHDKTWIDGAAQQDDYTCSVCKTKIVVNVSEWASRPRAVEPPKEPSK